MLTIENSNLIHVKEITQEIYDNAVQSTDFNKIKCSCGTKGKLVKMGSYLRCFKTPLKRTYIQIQRVKCKYCGKTHAVFIECMVPSSMLLVNTQFEILKAYYNNTTNNFLHAYPTIDFSNILYVVKNYKLIWQKMLLDSNLSLSSGIEIIVEYFFKTYNLQFMEMRLKSVILKSKHCNNLV